MSSTAADVLNVARSQLGTVGGRKYWNAVMGTKYVSGSATPWCACFVSWCFAQAGAKCAGLPAAGCDLIYSRAKAAGALVPFNQAKPGDVVLFNFDSDLSLEHIGIVEKPGLYQLQTIEGNTNAAGSATGNAVARKTRQRSVCYAIVRPNWAACSKPAQAHASKPTAPQLLDVDGVAGKKTIAALQRQLGSKYVDGVISGQASINKHYMPAVTAVSWEGNGQSECVKLLQKLLGCSVDGFIGRQTATALNKRLGLDGCTINAICVRELQKRLNAGKI